MRVEIACSIVFQLTHNLTIDSEQERNFASCFVDHTTGRYPVAASGQIFDAMCFAAEGEVVTDLTEDLAADGVMV